MIGCPLLLQPSYDEKIWGGRRLETVLGKCLPPRVPVGESLESGDAATVAGGPFAGRTLGELVQAFPDALLGSRGRRACEPFGDFPLLVKFIDAADVLSLQVHPDDTAALPLSKRGKTEAWHIIDAAPGAELITGLSREVTAEEVRQAIEQGTFEDLIQRRTVTRGDTLIVPAGTIHAIGGGILLYEIQESCDITYRLYDWGRVDAEGRPRALHLDDALQVLAPSLHARPTPALALDDRRTILAVCRYFTLERWTVDGEMPLASTGGASFRLLSCLDGCCEVRAGPGQPAVTIAQGQTVLLPADLGEATLSGRATLLCAWIADLTEDVVVPLLNAGHAPDQVALLGGATGDMQGPLAAAQRARAARRRR